MTGCLLAPSCEAAFTPSALQPRTQRTLPRARLAAALAAHDREMGGRVGDIPDCVARRVQSIGDNWVIGFDGLAEIVRAEQELGSTAQPESKA